MVIMGYGCFALGAWLIVMGFILAAMRAVAMQGKGAVGLDATFVDALKLIPDILKALTQAPMWLAFMAIGAGLIAGGAYLLSSPFAACA